MTAPGFFAFDTEAVYAALFAKLSAAYAWQNDLAVARRVKLWADVPTDTRPAMFQFEGYDAQWDWTNSANPKVTLEAGIFIYTDCKEPTVVGATQINNIMTAIANAMIPSGPDLTTGRQTLGGLVQWARIQGTVTRVPGDLDGDGMMIVPIKMLVG